MTEYSKDEYCETENVTECEKEDISEVSTRVALISMPTLSSFRPSFQLALLKPTLQRAGINVQTFSLYMYFAAHIGFKLNDVLADVRPCIPSEWLWSKAAFGDFCNEDEYIDHYRDTLEALTREAGCSIDDLKYIRNHKTFSFIDFCLNSTDWSRFQLIGFSIVFQQMTASLALAQAMKERFPHIPIILGGGAFEDDIAFSIMQGCPYIDFIHCGDADETFPQMLRRFDRGESMEDVPGLMWRKDGDIIYNGRAPNLMDMDSTPIPDYDEYYYAVKASGFERSPIRKNLLLPIETARGCWWGYKNHCAFCGLNCAGLKFRCKSPDNALEMIKELSLKYNHLVFNAIDNIMSNDYIEHLFGKLADNHSDIKLHYEVRPHFSRKQLGRMKRGGLFSVQPGIESYSTHSLKLMNKLLTGIRNVEFTKWCTYYGITNLYNILHGFPGETVEDVEIQCRLFDKILHLQPPYCASRARPERGSPMYRDLEGYSISEMTPLYCYHHIYPSDQFDLDKVSHYFQHEIGNVLTIEELRPLYLKIRDWRQSWHGKNRCILKYKKSWEAVHIFDTRFGDLRRYIYKDREMLLFDFLQETKTFKAIMKEFDNDIEWIQKILSDFMDKDLVLFMDNRYLNLVLPDNPYL
jgi:ribosomal peptide maturation radical SAM protein 1